jgi:hypothetical protein
MRRVLRKSRQLGEPNWDAVFGIYDEAGSVSETYEHAGDFNDW